ncbi:MAG: bifunctional DNA-formamidopyrimidine glycosylase/DNA-(apurinic or apyrimidinic site) lyase [Desulfofustis sp.]|nr:bifunctional DNA-formamidopyrimidine glycosylase/DNA-(apurinic or apyrimidinic site) lyase [Desulfofustis sp.]
MPELPEVEVVRRGLLNHLPGRTIAGLSTDGKKMRLPVPETALRSSLIGARITNVRRRAKYLLIDMDNGSVLIVHLGMTGILGLFPINTELDVHDHVCWSLDNGYELRFNDPRRFGSVQIVGPNHVKTLEQTLFKATGPEPFAEHFDGRYLYDKAHKKQQPVKNFIMDGRVVAGVGNIYANESLFSAGIRPTRKAGAISKKRYSLLVDKIREVLTTAIDCGGSTISDFLDASGTSGYFQIHFNVYGRKDQPCPVCSTPIRNVKLGGRASYFCPGCQR